MRLRAEPEDFSVVSPIPGTAAAVCSPMPFIRTNYHVIPLLSSLISYSQCFSPFSYKVSYILGITSKITNSYVLITSRRFFAARLVLFPTPKKDVGSSIVRSPSEKNAGSAYNTAKLQRRPARLIWRTSTLTQKRYRHQKKKLRLKPVKILKQSTT